MIIIIMIMIIIIIIITTINLTQGKSHRDGKTE